MHHPWVLYMQHSADQHILYNRLCLLALAAIRAAGPAACLLDRLACMHHLRWRNSSNSGMPQSSAAPGCNMGGAHLCSFDQYTHTQHTLTAHATARSLVLARRQASMDYRRHTSALLLCTSVAGLHAFLQAGCVSCKQRLLAGQQHVQLLGWLSIIALSASTLLLFVTRSM